MRCCPHLELESCVALKEVAVVHDETLVRLSVQTDGLDVAVGARHMGCQHREGPLRVLQSEFAEERKLFAEEQARGRKVGHYTCNTSMRDDLDGYDAFITNLKGCAIGVRTADCIPVLLYDPKNAAVAAIHSGWKGTLNRISQKTIFKMKELFGTVPADLKAVIGPGICRKCFQVGEEVVNYFKGNGIDIEPIYFWDGPKQEGMKGGHHLDLIEENRLLLVECGVPADSIQVSGICTYEDTRFYSARREGRECGRIINSIKLL